RALHHGRPPPSPRGVRQAHRARRAAPGTSGALRRAPHSTRIQRGRCGRENADGLDSTAVKIYTRAGDDGTTGTLGKGRVAKSDPRIEAYGTIDELNAALGAARAADTAHWLLRELEDVQRQLFQVGAELATTDTTALASLVRVCDADVAALEATIDRLESE